MSETQISRELSPDETKVLNLTDGKRTVGEMLTMSQMEPDRFLIALESLKVDAALQTVVNQSAGTEEKKPQESVSRAWTPLLIGRKWMYALLTIAGVLAVIAVVYGLRHSNSVVGNPGAGIQVDASPFANVRILNPSGQIVHEAMTPFIVSLPDGKYSIEFEYRGNKRSRDVVIDRKPIAPLRESFLEPNDIEEIIKAYLPEP